MADSEEHEQIVVAQAADLPGEESAGPVTYAYIGPTIPRLLIGPSYWIGYPTWLEPNFKECPAIKALFIDHEAAPAMLQTLRDRHSWASVLFAQVLQYAAQREKIFGIKPGTRATVTMRPQR